MSKISFEKVKNGINKTWLDIKDYNQRMAQASRLKSVVRSEAETVNRAYIALGKAYFKKYRDSANLEEEILCEKIEVSIDRIKVLSEKIAELKEAKPEKIIDDEFEVEFYNYEEPVEIIIKSDPELEEENEEKEDDDGSFIIEESLSDDLSEIFEMPVDSSIEDSGDME